MPPVPDGCRAQPYGTEKSTPGLSIGSLVKYMALLIDSRADVGDAVYDSGGVTARALSR